MPAFLLAIPAWAWWTGGAVVGGSVLADQVGDAAEQIGDAAEKSTEMTKWLVTGATLYMAYKALKSSGALK